MAYVAAQSLLWGDETIPAGAPVPADEHGRDYAGMVHLGQIREVDDTAGLSDDAVRAELRSVSAERDALRARVAELEAGEDIPVVEVPDGVVPGETPGWPLVILPLTDEQRQLLAEGGVSGTVTIGELHETISLLRDAAGTGGDDDGKGGGETSADDDGLPEGVTQHRGGWFELPDGTKVRGRKALDDALAKTGS